MFLALNACRPGGAQPASGSSVTLRVGVRDLPSSPTEGLTAVAGNLTLEALVRIGEDGRPQAQLAHDWRVSEEGRAVTVNLLSGVKFHDGTPLTAPVVVDALKSTLPVFMGPAFDDVESVSASSSEQIVIRLRRPSAFLIDALEASIPKPGTTLVGTGPFIVTDAKSPTEMRANPDYHLGRPIIDRITVQAFPSVRAAWAELLRDRLDMLYEVGVDAQDSLEASNQISVFNYNRRYQYVIVLNPQADVFRSKDVRRALNIAIDRNAVIRDALGGRGLASSGPVWPHNYAFPKDSATIQSDPAAAARMLSANQTGANRGRKIHFPCLVLPGGVHERIALVVKQQLAAVGIDMSVEELGMDKVLESMKNRRFEALLNEMVSAPTLLRPYRMWHSGGSTGASSPTIDAALDRVRHAASDDEYASAVAAFQQAMLDDPQAIFIAWIESARAVTKRFVVPAPEPGRDIMSTIRLWKPAVSELHASRN
ncbi:MAG TPA: ABC transporter substrate-binding protein [Vicinamibacterales bacterium]|nr:ABC transporter substrate-binding protein [Vicinamibacterales bacterium]